ncbi:hypothetical protein NQZ68_006086 [Dissostichus eleginoides]|nr:hypothetical protein NQZ68_006086 [Dissostichus eleginoides]
MAWERQRDAGGRQQELKDGVQARSSEETDTARYLGGNPYGRSQSDVDGITATLVLMRSSLALMMHQIQAVKMLCTGLRPTLNVLQRDEKAYS